MNTPDFDIIVIGGGHAGVEAALAAGRMGRKAAIVTMNRQQLALMSCNPAIGGIGKSQLVKEIDALGGLMGQAADATGIQFRRLNLSRGPAVWSTRIQSDRIAYNQYVVDSVEQAENVTVIEGTVDEILIEANRASGVRLFGGETMATGAVVVASGTFLSGLIHIGNKKIKAGRLDDRAAYKLSDNLRQLGFEVGRLKTGTPPRLEGDTVDWTLCQRQEGEDPPPLFSWKSNRLPFEQTACHLTRTTIATKQIVSANFEKSAIFSGEIKSIGPRYCPSIEDKFHRFADRSDHQIFLEPEGNGTSEVYPNGFSTALPENIQLEAIRTIIGLAKAVITRPGYAVEYDYCPAHQIDRSFQTRLIKGLFFAGQINGTSGYEEAAAQGVMAGANAVLDTLGEPPLLFDRSQAYIGVMADDLTTRSTTEPYRMFTSRAEYRLALREDNARDRLSEAAYQSGLITTQELDQFQQLEKETSIEIERFRAARIETSDFDQLNLQGRERQKVSLAYLLKQPKVSLDDLAPILASMPDLFSSDREVLRRAAIRIKYQGYVEKQQREIDKFKKQESELIPENLEFESIAGLKTEAKEKLARFRPESLGQAGRLEGITAGDLAVLAVNIKRYKALKRSENHD